jgi:hypothetical protein
MHNLGTKANTTPAGSGLPFRATAQIDHTGQLQVLHQREIRIRCPGMLT